MIQGEILFLNYVSVFSITVANGPEILQKNKMALWNFFCIEKLTDYHWIKCNRKLASDIFI
jgi:hypothetical protein